MALLRCSRGPGSSDSSLQLLCVVGSGVSHLPLTPAKESLGQPSLSVKHWDTTVRKLATGPAVWAGVESYWEGKPTSQKAEGRRHLSESLIFKGFAEFTVIWDFGPLSTGPASLSSAQVRSRIRYPCTFFYHVLQLSETSQPL